MGLTTKSNFQKKKKLKNCVEIKRRIKKKKKKTKMDHTFDFLIQDLNLKYIHTFMKKNYCKMFYLEFHI